MEILRQGGDELLQVMENQPSLWWDFLATWG
jgi:hypothetical protein